MAVNPAAVAVEAIIDDLNDRGDLGFAYIDEDTMSEIRDTWQSLIWNAFKPASVFRGGPHIPLPGNPPSRVLP